MPIAWFAGQDFFVGSHDVKVWALQSEAARIAAEAVRRKERIVLLCDADEE